MGGQGPGCSVPGRHPAGLSCVHPGAKRTHSQSRASPLGNPRRSWPQLCPPNVTLLCWDKHCMWPTTQPCPLLQMLTRVQLRAPLSIQCDSVDSHRTLTQHQTVSSMFAHWIFTGPRNSDIVLVNTQGNWSQKTCDTRIFSFLSVLKTEFFPLYDTRTEINQYFIFRGRHW